MAHFESIDDLSDDQIEIINAFLESKERKTFSPTYIKSLRSDEFAAEVKENNEFIYRGKFISSPCLAKCVDDTEVKYVMSLHSCTADYTRTQSLLLDKNCNPIKICFSNIGV